MFSRPTIDGQKSYSHSARYDITLRVIYNSGNKAIGTKVIIDYQDGTRQTWQTGVLRVKS